MLPDSADDHHRTLYFDDGNVVFSAVDSMTQKRTFFRVHRSVLCRHSLVLADLFAMPPLQDDSPSHAIVEVYDGALYVQMPDSAEDLESLLQVLYDPLGIAYKRFNPNTPVLVHGALKLAIKYECEA